MNIVITIGDCNGIGIECMIKAVDFFNESYGSDEHTLVVAGNTRTIKEYCSYFNFPVEFRDGGIIIKSRYCRILECKEEANVRFGEDSQDAGMLAAEAIELAVEKTIAGDFDAIVTMPISKSAVYKAGWKYPGHTEMLADRCGVTDPLMILCTRSVRVALVTIHMPISEVPGNISQGKIVDLASIFNKSLKRDFAIIKPEIAVLGLNPHAGENSALGSEEKRIIIPAMEKLKMQRIRVQGPLPSDGFFAHGEYRFFDGILAMYHDQGLIPLKLLAGGKGVNVTAGLPIVRTSADHGTAFAIAGKDIADASSSLEAIEMAIDIASNRKK